MVETKCYVPQTCYFSHLIKITTLIKSVVLEHFQCHKGVSGQPTEFGEVKKMTENRNGNTEFDDLYVVVVCA